MKNKEKELAKITECDVGYEDHGCPFLFCTFEYEDSNSRQGFGYIPDMAFILRFLDAVCVDTLQKCVGKTVWVTHTNDEILRVDPLHKKEGKPFIIEDWKEWARKYNRFSASQMRGESPVKD